MVLGLRWCARSAWLPTATASIHGTLWEGSPIRSPMVEEETRCDRSTDTKNENGAGGSGGLLFSVGTFFTRRPDSPFSGVRGVASISWVGFGVPPCCVIPGIVAGG